jgi:polyisoprenyl-phosphate glycosyltransferase
MGGVGGPVRKRITVVTSAYNEAECIDELARRLTAVFDQMPAYDFEAIVVENGSQDDTFERLEAICLRDPRFKVVQLARNFRMDGGLTAGLASVDGDAVVLMTADLQDPPEMIPRFVAKWEEGYENVYGIVTARRGTGRLRTLNSRLFYWTIGRLTGGLIPANASDFRLLDRKVYQVVREMDERNRFVRGLVAWVGFRSVGIEHEREERFAGTSKAHSLPVLQLAIKAVFAHSQVPLVIIPTIGIGLFITSIVTLVVLTIDFVALGVPFPGFGTIVALMVMMFGILFCLLGIVSVYIGLIYEEVKGRPNFIVRQTLGLESPLARSEAADLLSDRDSGKSSPMAERGIGRMISDPERAEPPLDLSATDGDPASSVSGS